MGERVGQERALQELSSASLADQAYGAIRAAIVNGELPPGERITERGLAAMLSVSPTPVREAIRRLEQEGLLERRGSRTTVVFDARATSRYELALIEAALRSTATRLAATNRSEAALARMQSHLDEADRLRDEMRKVMADGGDYPGETAELLLLELRSFHAEVEAACGNPVLLRMLSTVNAFSFQHRVSTLKARITSGTISDTRYLEHHQILDAIRRGDADRAEELVARHAREAAEAYLR